MDKTLESKHITVSFRKDIKSDKKGKAFFSVKTSLGEWFQCYITELFETLNEGWKGEVVIETYGDFKKITDLVGAEIKPMPKWTPPAQKAVEEGIKVMETDKEIMNALARIEEKLDKVAKFVGAEL